MFFHLCYYFVGRLKYACLNNFIANLFRGEIMEYDNFKDNLKKGLSKYNINLNNKIIAIIFKVLSDLDIIS